jgi:hypothetical protein
VRFDGSSIKLATWIGDAERRPRTDTRSLTHSPTLEGEGRRIPPPLCTSSLSSPSSSSPPPRHAPNPSAGPRKSANRVDFFESC